VEREADGFSEKLEISAGTCIAGRWGGRSGGGGAGRKGCGTAYGTV